MLVHLVGYYIIKSEKEPFQVMLRCSCCGTGNLCTLTTTHLLILTLIVVCFSIEGEYVPVEGDEVTYKVCRVPPKNLKVQAVEVKITHLNPGTKHETWSGQIISS